MVLKREVVEERFKELDRILRELDRYRGVSTEVIGAELSQRWIIERGLIAAATLIFDIADHILAGRYGIYAETYEGALRSLRDQRVISGGLYDRIRGLGGFRNILVHRYTAIDPLEVHQSFHRALETFPIFAREVLSWLNTEG